MTVRLRRLLTTRLPRRFGSELAEKVPQNSAALNWERDELHPARNPIASSTWRTNNCRVNEYLITRILRSAIADSINSHSITPDRKMSSWEIPLRVEGVEPNDKHRLSAPAAIWMTMLARPAATTGVFVFLMLVRFF